MEKTNKVKIPFIDIHTHNRENHEEVITVQSLFLQNIELQNEITTLFSAGIHPWHATKFTIVEVSSMLEKLEKDKGLIAIGETGLDRFCKVDFQQQKLIFELHLEFAEKYRKPIIIHAVKTLNDLIIYLKRAKVPFIFHGYQGSTDITKQLINFGCYFSLGKSVLSITPRFLEAIQIIPPKSLFLETDDSNTDIREIYLEVSKIRGISLEELKIQITENFTRLFELPYYTKS